MGVGLGGGYVFVRHRELIQTSQVAGGSGSTSGSPMLVSGFSTGVSTGGLTNSGNSAVTGLGSSPMITVIGTEVSSITAGGTTIPTFLAPLSAPTQLSNSTSREPDPSITTMSDTQYLRTSSPSPTRPNLKSQSRVDKPSHTSTSAPTIILPLSSISPGTTPSSTPPIPHTGNSYLSKTYSGVATHCRCRSISTVSRGTGRANILIIFFLV